MIVSFSEFKANIGLFLSIVEKEDIIITRNGKRVARLTKEEDKVALAQSLIGILPEKATKEDAREEKYKRHL